MQLDDSNLENIFFDFCKESKIQTFIDIGSNRPVNARRFLSTKSINSANALEPNAFSFEANPYCFSYFFDLYQDPNHSFLNLAIGRRNGFVELSIPQYHTNLETNKVRTALRKIDYFIFLKYHRALAHFHLATNQGGSTVRSYEQNVNILAPIMRFDNIGIELKQNTVVWVDVEGSLVDVLVGFGELLKSNHIKAFYVEAEGPTNTLDEWKKLNSYTHLISSGFKLIAFSELNNGIFVRESDAQNINLGFPYKPKSKIVKKRRTLFLRFTSIFWNIDKFLLRW
jgi:hypothetical protein